MNEKRKKTSLDKFRDEWIFKCSEKGDLLVPFSNLTNLLNERLRRITICDFHQFSADLDNRSWAINEIKYEIPEKKRIRGFYLNDFNELTLFLC